MRKSLIIVSLLAVALLFVSFIQKEGRISTARLRKLYSQSPDKWPAPFVDSGIQWKELGQLPYAFTEKQKDSLRHIIELGKQLFFDARLSGSGKISCATCHQPELNWTDGKQRSVGHDGATNKRNAPTIQNTWFYDRLFWDGRARDLEDQAFAPINSESEMHHDMRTLPFHLRKIKGYAALFDSAYGDAGIDPDRIAHAIAVFERTISSQKTRFDEFLQGKKNKLNNEELRGLHLFRTKARCMNCHNGPLFTDNRFQKTSFSTDDPGHYQVTHKDEDAGKFKTPSLRDVMRTGPWLHDGKITSMPDILSVYNKMSPSPAPGQKARMLYLNKREIADLLAFLNAISAPPASFSRPVLPE